MGRPPGSRSRDHDARRQEIVARIAKRLSQRDAMHASYRELAQSAEVSLSMLQHYFGRREDVIAAVLDQARQDAEPYLAHARQSLEGLAHSMTAFLAHLRLGFDSFGLGELHALALTEGLRNSVLGPKVVASLLEPSIEALTARLEAHQASGDMRPDSDARHAALMLLMPVIMLLLHQRELGGASTHPVDLDRFMADQVGAFVRAHGMPAAL